MNALLLFAVLTVAPDEVEDAPVERLSLLQLESEAERVAEVPEVGPAPQMLAVGASMAVTCGALWYFAAGEKHEVQARGDFAYGWVMAELVLAALTVTGSAMTIIGSITFPIRLRQHRLFAGRKHEVSERLAAVRRGDVVPPREPPPEPVVEEEEPAPPPAPSATVHLRRQMDDRSRALAPIGLMLAGLGVGALAGAVYAIEPREGVAPSVAVIGLFCAALAMEGLGTVLLITRLQSRREEMERESAAAPPPPASKLPPAPVWLGYAWRF